MFLNIFNIVFYIVYFCLLIIINENKIYNMINIFIYLLNLKLIIWMNGECRFFIFLLFCSGVLIFCVIYVIVLLMIYWVYCDGVRYSNMMIKFMV